MSDPRNDITRIDNVIRRLFAARDTLPSVRQSIDDWISDALDAQGEGGGSGISDPTGARAGKVAHLQQRHRDLNTALAGIERSLDHLLVTAERCLATPKDLQETNGSSIRRDPTEPGRPYIVDTTRADIDYTKVAKDTCPNMVVRTLNINGAAFSKTSQRLERCGQITASKRDDNGTIIGVDPDGYCVDCRRTADARATDAALAEALTTALRRGA